mmetsp:Transcript_25555/g.70246  ORF Transcript_25555/g.70246 Transcript_25555/m.70246 type:complete len:214 (+) Transcript_25555:171-812(+)
MSPAHCAGKCSPTGQCDTAKEMNSPTKVKDPMMPAMSTVHTFFLIARSWSFPGLGRHTCTAFWMAKPARTRLPTAWPTSITHSTISTCRSAISSFACLSCSSSRLPPGRSPSSRSAACRAAPSNMACSSSMFVGSSMLFGSSVPTGSARPRRLPGLGRLAWKPSRPWLCRRRLSIVPSSSRPSLPPPQVRFTEAAKLDTWPSAPTKADMSAAQ